jgi:cytochrome c biogenesis protein CcmG, thiol:disulfide interchange protein DsbE
MSQVTMASPPASPPAPSRSWQQRLRESRFGTVLVLAVTAAIVMGGAYLVDHPTAAAGVTPVKVAPGDGPAPKIGSAAQDFTATTVDGKQVSLSSFKGQPVWLTFGASWCAACVAEAPDIERAYQSFKAKGVVVLAIFITEDSASVRDYATRVGLTFPKVADPDSRIASLYRVYGIPAHFFIDKAGVLRSTKTGGLSSDQIATALNGITQ